jgi:putative transposase
MGSSRSAGSCRSPHPPTTSVSRSDRIRHACRAGTAGCGPQARGRARVRRELRGLRRAQGLAADDAGGLCDRPLHRARLMREMGLAGVIRGKPVRTTISDKAAPCPLDHVNRQFCAGAEPAVGVGLHLCRDLGGVRLRRLRHRYLCRRIVGWRASRTAHASFVLDALEQALHDRRPAHRGGLVHHSDRGSQYVSIKYTERLAEAGIEPSVGSVGDSYDNALPRRSTASTRPRSSIGVDPGDPSKRWNTRRSNGSTGSTIAGCWSPSATSRQPKPKNDITPRSTMQPMAA